MLEDDQIMNDELQDLINNQGDLNQQIQDFKDMYSPEV